MFSFTRYLARDLNKHGVSEMENVYIQSDTKFMINVILAFAFEVCSWTIL